jgi:hypothetical protein
MMPRSPEQGMPPIEEKEAQEPKVEFDWNKHLELELERTEENDLVSEFKTLAIEGPKGKVDILKLVDAKKAFLKFEGETGGVAYGSGDVEINQFGSLADLAVLMHEFGHTKQNDPEQFDPDIYELHMVTRNIDNIDDKEVRLEVFKRLIKKFPELMQVIKSDSFNQEQMEAVIRIATKIAERDANARALKWFREIGKETGLDFFKKFQVLKKDVDLEEELSPEEELDIWEEEIREDLLCENSIKMGVDDSDPFSPDLTETTIVEEINKALKSHGAETLTDTYDPGKTGKRVNIKPKSTDA